MKIILTFITLLLISTRAFATPPDIITIRDELFGMSETHVFIMRTTSDNHGLHETGSNDVLFMAIDIEARAERMWHLYYVKRMSDYANDQDGRSEVVTSQLSEELVNPFVILDEYGGVTTDMIYEAARYDFNGNAVDEEVTFGMDDDYLWINYESGETYKTPSDFVKEIITESLWNTTDAVQEYDRFGQLTHKDIMPYLLEDSNDCWVDRVQSLRALKQQEPVQLALVSCGEIMDQNRYSTLSMYVVVPQETE